jgi:hypothetical protein
LKVRGGENAQNGVAIRCIGSAICRRLLPDELMQGTGREWSTYDDPVIVYLRKKGDSLGPYLRDWDASAAERVRVFQFEELRSWEAFPSATYIFTALETLNASQLRWATELWERLSEAPARVRLLNDPRRVLGRYELLRLLHERGVNSHRAYRLHEAHRARFPVFLRRERRHWGITRVLWSRHDLARAVVWAARKGWPLNDLLVVEFIDTVDEDGLYHKYGAFFVGGRVVPGSLVFRSDWMVKSTRREEIPVSKHLELEDSFVEANPHESWIKDVFSMAGIDYGRIDYSVSGGRPRAWEINTNPTLVGSEPPPAYLHPHLRHFAETFGPALAALDNGLPTMG